MISFARGQIKSKEFHSDPPETMKFDTIISKYGDWAEHSSFLLSRKLAATRIIMWNLFSIIPMKLSGNWEFIVVISDDKIRNISNPSTPSLVVILKGHELNFCSARSRQYIWPITEVPIQGNIVINSSRQLLFYWLGNNQLERFARSLGNIVKWLNLRYSFAKSLHLLPSFMNK